MSIEQGLVERARLGSDGKAFSRLVQMHQAKLRSFLLRLSQNHALSDDLAQETFLLAFRKLHSYSAKGSFSAWLFQIAYRCFLEHKRRDARREEINSAFLQEIDVLQSVFEEINTVQIDLEKALAKLETGERAVLSLCHSYGFSHSEAAGILDIPVGTVKTRISQGKEKLHMLLNQEQKIVSTAT